MEKSNRVSCDVLNLLISEDLTPRPQRGLSPSPPEHDREIFQRYHLQVEASFRTGCSCLGISVFLSVRTGWGNDATLSLCRIVADP